MKINELIDFKELAEKVKNPKHIPTVNQKNENE